MPKLDEAGEKGRAGLSLPWLKAVQQRATRKTGELRPEQVAEVEAQQPPQLAEDVSPSEESPPETVPQAPEAQPEAHAAPELAAPPETPKEAAPAQEASVPEPVSAQPEESTAPLASTPGPGAPDEPPPNWVVGILEPETAPAPSPEESYEPEEMEHIMPWLTGAPEDAESADTQPGQGGAAGLPPWLGDVTVQETLQSRAPGAEAKPADVTDLDLEGVEPFIPPDVEVKKAPELSSGPMGRAPDARTEEKVPEWLQTIAPPAEEKEDEGEPRLDRDERITRVTLTPTDTLAEPPMREVPVRPPRQGSVETLAALLQPASSDALRRAVPGALPETGTEVAVRRVGLSQWLFPDGIIYIAIVAVLLAVLIIRPPLGDLNAPTAPDVLEFYNAVEAVPQNSPVLVVYDWDASRSAEMASLSQAVTHHLMARRIPFVTISTVPQGPGFAQQVTADAAADPDARYGYEYGRDYLVLGYLPGNEAGLSALVHDFSSVSLLDYVRSQGLETHEIVRNRQLNSVSDFALIIDLVSDEAALRNWIEQIATRTQVPIVAAVPQGMEPVARPYRGIAGPGLKAVVSGQTGATQYAQQLSQGRSATRLYSAGRLADRLNAQSVAQLLVAVVILASFVSLGARRVLRK